MKKLTANVGDMLIIKSTAPAGKKSKEVIKPSPDNKRSEVRDAHDRYADREVKY